jgi:hypothetical protein
MEMTRTTLVLPKEVLRRAKVKAALVDKTLSELVSDALERDIADMSGVAEQDLAWLKLAEPAFAFWDNADDAIFDGLR